MLEQQQRAFLPELDIDQYRAVTEAFRVWIMAKAEFEANWSEDQRVALRRLDPDIWHSAFLYRLLYERKPPLPEPPPTEHAYPVYPKAEPPQKVLIACSSCGTTVELPPSKGRPGFVDITPLEGWTAPPWLCLGCQVGPSDVGLGDPGESV